jgi:drug/metabolite transporter (DMT)-like permease
MPSTAPGVAAAISFGISDVLVKVVLLSGCNVTTMLLLRSILALGIMGMWLPVRSVSDVGRRVRWISLGLGILFAGLISLLYKAIEAGDVPTAIFTYFIYPLLTGFGATLFGIETIRTRGVLCAVVALFGLAIVIGAHPAGLFSVGIIFAIGAAAFRTTILLITRRFLSSSDAWATTWYSGISTLLAFVAISALASDWKFPGTSVGWLALVGVSLTTTAGIFLLFVSTTRVGAFRSALIMQMEPLTVIFMSALLVGEFVTPIQGVGSAIMLCALTAFHLWR